LGRLSERIGEPSPFVVAVVVRAASTADRYAAIFGVFQSLFLQEFSHFFFHFGLATGLAGRIVNGILVRIDGMTLVLDRLEQVDGFFSVGGDGQSGNVFNSNASSRSGFRWGFGSVLRHVFGGRNDLGNNDGEFGGFLGGDKLGRWGLRFDRSRRR